MSKATRNVPKEIRISSPRTDQTKAPTKVGVFAFWNVANPFAQVEKCKNLSAAGAGPLLICSRPLRRSAQLISSRAQ